MFIIPFMMSNLDCNCSNEQGTHRASPTVNANVYPNQYQMLDDSRYVPNAPNEANGFLSKYQIKLPTAISSLVENAADRDLPANYQPSDYDVVSGKCTI